MVPNLIPKNSRIIIGGVLAEVMTAFFEKSDDVPFGNIDERPDKMLIFRSDGSKSVHSRPADEPHEDGFRLVILRVRDSDTLASGFSADGFEDRVADIAQKLLIFPGTSARPLDKKRNTLLLA